MKMENDVRVDLDELLTDLRGGATLLAKDLIEGIGLVKIVARLMMLFTAIFGFFILLYLWIFPVYQGAPCCYVLTWLNIAGALFSAFGMGVTVITTVRLRKKYSTLRDRYKRIVNLERRL